MLGGFPPDAHPNVRQVATLGVDPLHLLVRSELWQDAASSLDVLRGRRVSLGERGSNGALLAAELLRFAGLRPTIGDERGRLSKPLYSREADMIAKLRDLETGGSAGAGGAGRAFAGRGFSSSTVCRRRWSTNW